MTAPPAFISGAAVDTKADGAAVDLVHWWRSFDDPLLASLVERALAQNLDLQQARARVGQARAGLRHANADLLPAGQVSGQASESWQSLETPQGRIASALPGFEREAQSYELNLGASWELDLFGGKDAARDAARADWQASAAAAVAARLAVAAQTADTYVAIRSLQARLDVARGQQQVQQRLVDLVALQFRKGVAAELQLRQAEGALAQVKAGVPELEQGLEIAMNALDILLGVQPGSTRPELAAAAPIPVPPAVSSAGGPPALLRRRPDIIAAERTLAASNARIGVAMAEYYPKFSLGGLLGTATMGVSGLFGGNATQASGVLGLRWRLFDFGRIDAEIAAARGRNTEALAAYRLAVLRASEDVENAFSSLVKQQARAQIFGEGEISLGKARTSAFAAYKGEFPACSTYSTPTGAFSKPAMPEFRQRRRLRVPPSLPSAPWAAGGRLRRRSAEPARPVIERQRSERRGAASSVRRASATGQRVGGLQGSPVAIVGDCSRRKTAPASRV
ncbi:efflux transporter outer membrane subunit [Sphingomonas sp. 7/4-4]|uniref:efflux transporter outer membrane subunit n=1 Tax=Sphingomonas sp. 7/4-4 TaxID=3018446 RepID=UPI0022F3EE1A|nr:efflux transporter outer membrane subunit [Sphingomonas sp. 7/4-4]WBY08028.1 efflux transporter outer membrane subunit [Sphingomonas sp. 7/4-4]